MASTNTTKPKTTTTTKKATGTSSSGSISASHPAMLQWLVGFLLIIVAAWVANISEDSGNALAAFFALLWVIWLMNNSSRLKGLVP